MQEQLIRLNPHVEVMCSLEDLQIDDLPNTAILIGANGCGKTNFMRKVEAQSNNERKHAFYDFSGLSSIDDGWDINDSKSLRGDGKNLACYLLYLQREYSRTYDYICSNILRRLPNFDSFDIFESQDKAILRWNDKLGNSIDASKTSNGSLRIMALTTLLNQPPEFYPDILMLDEIEKSLHHNAEALIAGMVRVASHKCQIIVSTQSLFFIDEFEINEIIVIQHNNGRPIACKLNEEALQIWHEDHSLSDVWWTNLIGGNVW